MGTWETDLTPTSYEVLGDLAADPLLVNLRSTSTRACRRSRSASAGISVRHLAFPLVGEVPFVDGESEEDALDAYSRVVTKVAERLTPSVASLNVWHRDRRGRDLMGAGSGVAISAEGFVVTSAHVVAGASRGSASFVDGHETRFEVVGRDALSDLAVLRTNDDAARPAELGDASRLRVGQLVVAIGPPGVLRLRDHRCRQRPRASAPSRLG